MFMFYFCIFWAFMYVMGTSIALRHGHRWTILIYAFLTSAWVYWAHKASLGSLDTFQLLSIFLLVIIGLLLGNSGRQLDASAWLDRYLGVPAKDYDHNPMDANGQYMYTFVTVGYSDNRKVQLLFSREFMQLSRPMQRHVIKRLLARMGEETLFHDMHFHLSAKPVDFQGMAA